MEMGEKREIIFFNNGQSQELFLGFAYCCLNIVICHLKLLFK